MRLPNPWVGIPVALAAIGGAAVGYFVTAASCAPSSCVVPAIGVAVGSGLIAAIGVGVVVVLALRSLAEYRDGLDRDVLRFSDEEE